LLAQKVKKLTAVLQVKLKYPVLMPGSQAPPFAAQNIEGKLVNLDYNANQSTVLYVFSPDCHWCAENLDNIVSLAERAGDRYRFIGVSLRTEGLDEYLAHTHLPFPIYHSPPDTVRAAYDFRSTPSTIVIGNDGKVLKYWQGAYASELQPEVEGFFQLRLPGLVKSVSKL